MKQVLFFFFVLTSISSYGQETPASDFKRFQIGVNFSPDVAYRLLAVEKGANIPPSFAKNFDTLEIPKFGYTGGITFCYNIKSFVGIEVGVQYSNKGYQSKKQNLLDSMSLNNHGQLELFYISSKYAYNFHYIDIPVKVNFTVGKKKVRFFSSVGLVTNILVKATYTSIIEKGSNTKTSTTDKFPVDFNRVNFSPMLSLGIDYKINDRMNLRVEPTFRFGVLKHTNTPAYNYLYSGGINLAYYFGL